MGSMQKVIDFLKYHCNFNTESMFLDIGAGLGKPNIHVTLDPGVFISVGIEVEYIRWVLSLKNIQSARNERILMINDNIKNLQNVDPFTHIYMFDVGFPPDLLLSITNSFNLSRIPKILICYKNPKCIIETCGFNVQYINQLKVHMCGSRESHTVYFYTTRLTQIGKCYNIDTRYCPLIDRTVDRETNMSNILERTTDYGTKRALRRLCNISQLYKWIDGQIEQYLSTSRMTRSHIL